MKKILSILLACVLVFSLAACTKQQAPAPAPQPQPQPLPQAETQPEQEQEATFEPYIQPDEDVSELYEISCVKHARAFVGKELHEKSVSMMEIIMMMFSGESETSEEDIEKMAIRIEENSSCTYMDSVTGELYIIANSEDEAVGEDQGLPAFTSMTDEEFEVYAEGEMSGEEDQDEAAGVKVEKIWRFDGKIIAKLTAKVDMSSDDEEERLVDETGYMAVAYTDEEAITGMFLTPSGNDDLMLLLARGVEVNMSNEGMAEDEM